MIRAHSMRFIAESSDNIQMILGWNKISLVEYTGNTFRWAGMRSLFSSAFLQRRIYN